LSATTAAWLQIRQPWIPGDATVGMLLPGRPVSPWMKSLPGACGALARPRFGIPKRLEPSTRRDAALTGSFRPSACCPQVSPSRTARETSGYVVPGRTRDDAKSTHGQKPPYALTERRNPDCPAGRSRGAGSASPRNGSLAEQPIPDRCSCCAQAPLRGCAAVLLACPSVRSNQG
jgi:hypothetical protein